MRILHLTTFLQGGAGLAITALASAQAGAGHAVAVLASKTGVAGYGNYPAYLDALGDAAVRVRTVDSLFDRRPEAHRAVEQCLDDIGGAGAFDILHAHAAVPSAIARAAVDRTGRRVPVLQTMHGWGVEKTPAQAAADVLAMNRVDRIIVPARTSAHALAAIGVERRHLAIVPYGVGPAPGTSPADGHVRRMRAWRREGGLVVCCIGTLGARKNQQLLVDALPLVDPRRRVLAVFVGDGPAEPLRSRVTALGLDDRVRVLGYQPHARRYLRESDYLVLPSRSEGQPLAVLEAFCDGVPVLVSRIPELVELVDDGVTGWLFDENPQSLASALSAAVEFAGRRRAVAARARAVYQSRFTVERMVAGYMDEYARAS